MPETVTKFEFDAPVGRAWKDDSGRLLCEGVASSTALDKQSERVSKEGIELFAYHPPVELFNTHQPKAGEELGATLKHAIGDDMEFRIVAELYPDVPQAAKIWERMQAGAQYGLSFGGTIEKAHWEYDKEAGKSIRILDAVNLDHIMITRPGKEANPDCWLGSIAKAMDDSGAFPAPTENSEQGATGDATDGDAVTTETVGTDTPADANQEDTQMSDAAKQEDAQASEAEAKTEKPTTQADDANKQEPDGAGNEIAEKTDATDEATVDKSAADPAPKVPNIDALIQKAVDAGRSAAKEEAAKTIEDLEAEVAKAAGESAKLKAELEALKAAPADGGPEGKPDGEAEKADGAEGGDVNKTALDYVDEALKAGDREDAIRIHAASFVQHAMLQTPDAD